MNGGDIAFTAIGRGHTTEAAYRKDTRRQAVVGKRSDHDIKRHVVTAHDHKIGCAYRIIDQRDLNITAGIER
jgi:hypothetical protein